MRTGKWAMAALMLGAVLPATLLLVHRWLDVALWALAMYGYLFVAPVAFLCGVAALSGRRSQDPATTARWPAWVGLAGSVAFPAIFSLLVRSIRWA